MSRHGVQSYPTPFDFPLPTSHPRSGRLRGNIGKVALYPLGNRNLSTRQAVGDTCVGFSDRRPVKSDDVVPAGTSCVALLVLGTLQDPVSSVLGTTGRLRDWRGARESSMAPTFAERKPPSDTLKSASSCSITSGSAAPGASPLASAVPLWSPSHPDPGPKELARRSRAKRIRKGTFGEGVTARPPSDRQGWYWLAALVGAHSPLRPAGHRSTEAL